jgi:hypothetical protein
MGGALEKTASRPIVVMISYRTVDFYFVIPPKKKMIFQISVHACQIYLPPPPPTLHPTHTDIGIHENMIFFNDNTIVAVV